MREGLAVDDRDHHGFSPTIDGFLALLGEPDLRYDVKEGKHRILLQPEGGPATVVARRDTQGALEADTQEGLARLLYKEVALRLHEADYALLYANREYRDWFGREQKAAQILKNKKISKESP